jgi:hypothetical protein
MHAHAVPSETQPLLARKAERNVLTTRRTLGVFAAAACGVLGIAALQRGRLGAQLGAKHESPDEALKVQSEALMASHDEGLALMGDLPVRPFVEYDAMGRLGASSYQQCVGPNAKPVDYQATEVDAVRKDLVFEPSTSENRQTDLAVTEFGTSAEDVASIECKEPPAMIFSDVGACAEDGACDDECRMPVPENCVPGAKDFGSCTPTVSSVCSSLSDTFTKCNSASSKVKEDKKSYNNVDPGLSPCAGKPKNDAAAAQQAYKTALNSWADALNDATEVCTVGHGLWMYNTELYDTHHQAMVEISEDLQELCSQDDKFDFDAAIAEAKKSSVPTVRRRHLVWLQELCAPTIASLEDITDSLKVVTPELQCFAESCQSKIAAEANAFDTLKQAHGAYKTAFKTYKDEAEAFNAVVDDKVGKKEAILAALEIFQSDRKINAPIFERDLTNFMRFDKGADQGHCGLTECQVKSVCHSQIEKDFASFIKSDTCEAVPVSLDKLCAPPPPAPLSPSPPGAPPVPATPPAITRTRVGEFVGDNWNSLRNAVRQCGGRWKSDPKCAINTWDVSKMTSLAHIFSWNTEFNEYIGDWDVSNVRDFTNTFSNAHKFNQDISKWDMSSAKILVNMFHKAYAFVGEGVGNWDVSNVEDPRGVFSVTSFNQPLDKWDVRSMKDMNEMFIANKAFNQDLNSWDVSGVNNFGRIFVAADAMQKSNIESWYSQNAKAKYIKI